MRSVKEEIAELGAIEKEFKVLLEDQENFLVQVVEDRLQFIPCQIVTREEEVASSIAMSEFLFPRLRTIAWSQLNEADFDIFRQVIDDCYLYVKKVSQKYTFTAEEQEKFRAWTVALKLGGKIPPSYLLSSESGPFQKFILNNFLHHWLFAFRLQVPYNLADGPAIPVKGVGWVLWKEIKQDTKKDKIEFWLGDVLLFETNLTYTFTKDYSCLYEGIERYNTYIDPRFVPYDRRDPKEWGHKHILEVWTVCQTEPRENPSMFLNTHAYFVLRDDKGFLRCAGQDVILDIQQCKKTEYLSSKSGYGKIATPDSYVAFPKNSRQFWKASLEITKEQHDKIVSIVEKDKANKNHTISLMKKNCTSYVLKILREGIGLELDASMHGFHIFAKSLLPNKWYRKAVRRWESWYEQRCPLTQKLLFFFPLFYVPSILLATLGFFMSRKPFQRQSDFTYKDFLLRPWTMTSDHPLALHRQLEKHLNKNEKHR